MKKILFICSQNRVRSLTAEQLFRGRKGCQTLSAGIRPDARVRLTEDLLRWADLVVFMEQTQLDHVTKAFPQAISRKKAVCWQIGNDYYYGDPDLKKVLEEKMAQLAG